MSKVLLSIICFLFFASDVLSQGSQIPALRIYTNNKDKNDPSSFYLPLQYIDSIVHYNIVTPTVITGSAQSITRNSANISAKVISDGGGTISKTGFCWSTKEEPTINSAFKDGENFNGVNFSVGLLGLSKNTKYYVRAFAINESGISYGNQVEFTTVNSSDIVVIEGNEYNTVILGGKCFPNSITTILEENLKVTKYANGDTIRYVKNRDELIDAMKKQEGAFCYYNFDPGFDSLYGKMYNRFAVQDKRGLAPIGWKLIGIEELYFIGLFNDLICGGSMKSIGTVESKDGLWLQPNVQATNESGFSGHPGGVLLDDEFKHIGELGFWFGSNIIYYPYNNLVLVNQSEKIYHGAYADQFLTSRFGFNGFNVTFASVRCVKE